VVRYRALCRCASASHANAYGHGYADRHRNANGYGHRDANGDAYDAACTWAAWAAVPSGCRNSRNPRMTTNTPTTQPETREGDLESLHKGLEQAVRLLLRECFHDKNIPREICCSWSLAAIDVEKAIQLADEVERLREESKWLGRIDAALLATNLVPTCAESHPNGMDRVECVEFMAGEIDRLRAALEFYADEKTWEWDIRIGSEDRGQIARTALNSGGEETN
jgi:hypothetical protein